MYQNVTNSRYLLSRWSLQLALKQGENEQSFFDLFTLDLPICVENFDLPSLIISFPMLQGLDFRQSTPSLVCHSS